MRTIDNAIQQILNDKRYYLNNLSKSPLILLRMMGDTPIDPHWLERRETTHPEEFHSLDNIGVQLGLAGRVVEVQLNRTDVRDIAWRFLPPPFEYYGQYSDERRQCLFRVRNAGRGATFACSNGEAIATVRSDGCNAILPYSVFPHAEPICFAYSSKDWTKEGSPGNVEYEFEEIINACCELSIAAVLRGQWPVRETEPLISALGQCLKSHGWSMSYIKDFIVRLTLALHSNPNEMPPVPVLSFEDSSDALGRLASLIGADQSKNIADWASQHVELLALDEEQTDHALFVYWQEECDQRQQLTRH